MNSPHPRTHTRREVLKTTGLAVLAAGSTTLLPVTSGAPNAARKKRVIVAGGGIGGLCCAYELVERGHEVTVLEASRRTGGHVKTIRDPLPDGLYADVGAEHFTKPGYTAYWKYVEKFNLPAMPWPRRRNVVRFIDGEWFNEEQLADPAVLQRFGFNQTEVTYIVEHGWSELSRLYLDPYIAKFKDEYQPFGIGLDHLDEMLLGDLLANDGLSKAAQRFIGAGKRSTVSDPPGSHDASALYHVWQSAIVKMRGLAVFPRDVYHLKGGNQLLPDTFAAKLGDRIRRNCPISAIEHSGSSVNVQFEAEGKAQQLSADYLVMCISPLLMGGIKVTPAWPELKDYALSHTTMDMQSRVLFQTRTPFWEGDSPSINLEPGDSHLQFICETAQDVPGESCVLMSSGRPAQTPEESVTAFRKVYPGKAKDTIERCVVHEWWKEEPTCFGCERLAFPFGQLRKMWPALIEPVNRIHFAGAAYDNLNWGMDAATRSANRVAQAIHTA